MHLNFMKNKHIKVNNILHNSSPEHQQIFKLNTEKNIDNI